MSPRFGVVRGSPTGLNRVSVQISEPLGEAEHGDAGFGMGYQAVAEKKYALEGVEYDTGLEVGREGPAEDPVGLREQAMPSRAS